MATLFQVFRDISTCAILIILVKSFGYKDPKTWGIFALVYIAMIFDYMSELYKK